MKTASTREPAFRSVVPTERGRALGGRETGIPHWVRNPQTLVTKFSLQVLVMARRRRFALYSLVYWAVGGRP